MPKAPAKQDRDDLLRKLHTQLGALEDSLRGLPHDPLPPAALKDAASNARRLRQAAARVDSDWAPAFDPLLSTLDDADAAAGLAAEHVLNAVRTARGALPLPGGADDAPPQAAPEALRAESPPPRYWRRWGGDAPEATAPVIPAPAPAPAPRPAAVIARPQRPAAVQAEAEAPYRVLIVEDDPSQALFAESVLVGSGMQARLVMSSDEVMDALAEFDPELVLMDLHMPGASGIDLTARIREQPAYNLIPIVFLTGDPDPEKQFEVLELGADDFLSKPIRPRHLIAAVQNRIMRARMARPAGGVAAPEVVLGNGLSTRAQLLDATTAAVAARAAGALYFLEIEGTTAMRDRFGYAALERLLADAGRAVGEIAAPHAAARINDNSFLVLAQETAADAQLEFARTLRDGLGRRPLDIDGQTLRLRVLVGYTPLDGGFVDAGGALAGAERALRDARGTPVGIGAYAPAPADDPARRSGEVDALRRALDEDRLELSFQPIVAVAGGEEAQYQTLLRIRNDDGSLRTAADVLPVAEAGDLLHEVDRRVLDKALEVLGARAREGKPLRLFVSQSPRSLMRGGYADALLAGVSAAGIDGRNLVVDVRQEDALIHAVSLQEFGTAMVPAGVQLCLSQYTSSAESDALLSQLPLGFVRLGSRYSTGLADNAVRDAMRTAIEKAHRQGLQVIGQQVEDPQAAATLWISGIDYIQGNLVQRATGGMDFDFQHSVL